MSKKPSRLTAPRFASHQLVSRHEPALRVAVNRGDRRRADALRRREDARQAAARGRAADRLRRARKK